MPDPEEVLTNVLADMFEPWEPASPRTIAFSKMLRAKLDERGIRLARVVPEDRPALTLDFVRRQTGYDAEFFEVQINVGDIKFQAGDLTARECDQVRAAAGVPALDDDTRRELERIVDEIGDPDRIRELAAIDLPMPVTWDGEETPHELLTVIADATDAASAYLGGTDGR